MAVEDLGKVEVHVRRYTEDADPTRGTHLAPQEFGAGTYVVGFVLEGAFIPLSEVKAGGVLKKIAAAEADKPKRGSKTPLKE